MGEGNGEHKPSPLACVRTWAEGIDNIKRAENRCDATVKLAEIERAKAVSATQAKLAPAIERLGVLVPNPGDKLLVYSGATYALKHHWLGRGEDGQLYLAPQEALDLLSLEWPEEEEAKREAVETWIVEHAAPALQATS